MPFRPFPSRRHSLPRLDRDPGIGSDAGGDAWINSEVDYYRFVACLVSGAYRFSTSTPTGPLDTVLGVFQPTCTGQRLAYNNDAAPGNTDSDATLTLASGQKYFLAVTNLNGSLGGRSTSGRSTAPPSTTQGRRRTTREQTASDLGTLTTRFVAGNLVMADAADWYRFTTAGTGAADSSVRITFSNALGDLAHAAVQRSRRAGRQSAGRRGLRAGVARRAGGGGLLRAGLRLAVV